MKESKKEEMVFLFDGGDGDQDFFSQAFYASSVTAPWFDSNLPRGHALLLIINDGRLKNEFLAITSRTNHSIEDQILNNINLGFSEENWISVVVHRVNCPNTSFNTSDACCNPVGMAAIKLLNI